MVLGFLRTRADWEAVELPKSHESADHGKEQRCDDSVCRHVVSNSVKAQLALLH